LDRDCVGRFVSLTRTSLFSSRQQPIWNFEQEPFVEAGPDETSIDLRAYLHRMRDDKMRARDLGWMSEKSVLAADCPQIHADADGGRRPPMRSNLPCVKTFSLSCPDGCAA
jgi:hypothetical protein